MTRAMLPGAAFVVSAGVVVYELQWIARSSLAWVIIALGVAIALLAADRLLELLDRRGKGSP